MLFVLVLLVVVAFVVLGGLAFMLAIGSMASDEKAQRKAIAEFEVLLDEKFDGNAHVTAKLSARTLPFETVLIGARERGYELVAETVEPAGKTLVFTRRAA